MRMSEREEGLEMNSQVLLGKRHHTHQEGRHDRREGGRKEERRRNGGGGRRLWCGGAVGAEEASLPGREEDAHDTLVCKGEGGRQNMV